MYQCYICGRTFDFPYSWNYTDDMNSERAIQDFYVPLCPFCGSDKINEFKQEDE